MEYREFKKTKEKVSLLGFGCMRLPILDNNPAEIDDSIGFELIDYAIANGVNYFDTAYMYHDGKSELFVARALSRHPRESFFLADKMPLWAVNSPEDIDRIFNEQLKKCGVDYFDFYLMHAMDKSKFNKAIEFGLYDKMQGYRREGKIRNIGFSFHDSPEVLEEMLNTYEWDFTQLQINYLDWELQNAKKQYELLAERNIPCIVMEPVRGGALATLCPEANKILKDYAPDKSIASWAIRYAASLPGVLTVLSGMGVSEHVKDNISSFKPFSPLSKEEQDVLSQALAAYKKAQTIPCTGCRYCMDCPSGVDIPAVLSIYNELAMTEDRDSFKYEIKALGEKGPSSCIACGVCAPQCPQSIDIPEKMKKIADLYNS